MVVGHEAEGLGHKLALHAAHRQQGSHPEPKTNVSLSDPEGACGASNRKNVGRHCLCPPTPSPQSRTTFVFRSVRRLPVEVLEGVILVAQQHHRHVERAHGTPAPQRPIMTPPTKFQIHMPTQPPLSLRPLGWESQSMTSHRHTCMPPFHLRAVSPYLSTWSLAYLALPDAASASALALCAGLGLPRSSSSRSADSALSRRSQYSAPASTFCGCG